MLVERLGDVNVTSMDGKATKSAARRTVVAQILAMAPEDRRRQETLLCQRFEELPGLAQAGSVLLYASAFPEEVETRPMLLRALAMGKRLILPLVDRRAGLLRLFQVTNLDHDLRVSRLGIPEPCQGCPEVEPASVDWVLVPGLGFDRRGHRLGRGAGHYDKLLPTLRSDARRWALILNTQWLDDLPIEPHDQPLDGVADAFQIILGPPRPAIIP